MTRAAIVTIHQKARGTRAHPRFALMGEMSAGGVRLVMDDPLEPLSHLSIDVAGTDFQTDGRVAHARAPETPPGVRLAIGMRRTREKTIERKTRERLGRE